MGGCGGPNNLYNDAWLLDMTQEPWQWKQINIRNKKWAASHMWCNPACKVRKHFFFPRSNRNKILLQIAWFQVGSKLVVLGPVASASTDFQMIRHQVLPSNRNNAHLRVNANNQPMPPNPPNQNNLRSPYIRNQYGEPSNYHHRRDDIGVRQRINGDAANAARQNANLNLNANINAQAQVNGDEPARQGHAAAANDDDVQNRLQRNLHLRSRRHESDMLANMPKRFNDPVQSHERIAIMAAFNDANSMDGPSTSKVVSPRERRLQSLRRMEEKMQQMRKVNAPINEPLAIDMDQSAPQKRIKRNCIGLFVCDISNILLAEHPYIEWIEHKNFGHIANAPERLILSSLCAGNGELIMFGGLRKESLNRPPEAYMQVSNAMHFLQVPKEIIWIIVWILR